MLAYLEPHLCCRVLHEASEVLGESISACADLSRRGLVGIAIAVDLRLLLLLDRRGRGSKVRHL